MKSLRPEDGGSKVLRNAGILPQHHNPKDLDLNHRRESLKIRKLIQERMDSVSVNVLYKNYAYNA